MTNFIFKNWFFKKRSSKCFLKLKKMHCFQNIKSSNKYFIEFRKWISISKNNLNMCMLFGQIIKHTAFVCTFPSYFNYSLFLGFFSLCQLYLF